MQTLATIRRFHTHNFAVVIDAVEEHDLDLSFDEDGSTARDLDAGRLVAFAVRARVYFHSRNATVMLAEDYLGGCVYESFESFMDHRECGKQNRALETLGNPARCGSYFSEMVSEVCEQARKELTKIQGVKVRKVA